MGKTVRMLKLAGALSGVWLAAAPGAAVAAPAWLPDATTIFPPTGVLTPVSNTPADVGMSASGETVALFTEYDAGVSRLYAAIRPPGGTFGAPQLVADQSVGNAVVAVAPDGTAVAAWSATATSPGTLRYAVRSAGGSFGPAADLPGGERVYGGPKIGVDGAGTVTIAWVRLNDDSLGATVEALTRTAAGSLTSRQAVSGPNASFDFDLAVAPSGAAVLSYGDGYGVSAAYRDAGAASFGAASSVGAPALGAASFVHTAIAPDGTAAAGWWQCIAGGSGNELRVRAAVRPPGGPWSARRDVSNPDQAGASCTTFFDMDAAVDDAGVVTLAWTRYTAASGPILPERASTTAPHATTFGAVTPIGETVNSFDPTLTRTAGGGLLLAYRVDAGATYRMKAAARNAAGTWSTTVPIAPAGATGDQLDGENPHLAADANGNGVLLYGSSRNHGSPGDPPDAVLVAGFDGAGPMLSGVQIPANAPTGLPEPFSATATDVWSPASIGWAFGDGGTATGPSVTHAFGAPGTYTTTVTGTDALGNASAATGTTAVATILPVTPPDKTPPVMSGVSLLRKLFRVGPTPTATVARTRVKAGTQFRLTISEAATVRIAFVREAPGRRVGGRCRAIGPRTARRCTRLVSEGTLTRKVKAGKVRVTFSGRIGKRALKVGRHRATITATDAAGNRTTVKTPLRFRIVR